MRTSIAFLTLILLLFICPPRYGQGVETFSNQQGEWVFCNNCNIPVWVVLNTSPGYANIPQRHLYLYIPNTDFSEENLRKIFAKFAIQYPDPQVLHITSFSDKNILECQVKANTKPHRPTWDDEQTRQECHQLLKSHKTGFFRAYYYRSNTGEERFQYTPSPIVDEFIVIKLKEGGEETFTGELNSDLRVAAKRGDILKLKKLLTEGADINSRDWQGESALMSGNSLEVTELLLEHGAKLDLPNNYGVTPLIKASDLGQSKIVEMLLRKGANVNLKDQYGYTSLMRAARNGHESVIIILLKMSADVTTTNNLGETALMLARRKEHTKIINLLESNFRR